MDTPTEQQTPPASETDHFSTMFAKLSELGDNPLPTDLSAETPAPEAPAPAPEPPAPETPAPETPAPETPAPETPAPALTDDEILQRMAALVHKTPAPAPTPESEPEPTPEAPAPIAFTPEESDTLNKYLEEWPEVASAEAMIRRKEYHQIVQHVFAEIKKQYAPLEETVQILANELQLAQLKTVVPEYDAVDPDAVKAWVKDQPAYLQPAYNHVINKGTADEVADLVQRYRQATGATAPAAPAPAAPTPPSKKTDTALPADAKQAAASLAPVGSKRSVVAPSGEPADFDAAFAAFAAKA
jgi:ATP-dependent exoDNAse (exonuclease V) beta subunit